MELVRAQALAGYRQATLATQALVNLFNHRLVTAQGVQDLVLKGAMTDKLPVADWRETLKDDRVDVLAALLEGSELMDNSQKWDMLNLGVSYGSAHALRLLLDHGFGKGLSNPKSGWAPLKDAIRNNSVEKASLLLEAGADPLFVEGVGPIKHQALAWVSSVEMFDFLLSKGCRADSSDMLQACLQNEKGPNPELLRAFLATGCPTRKEGGGWAWPVLFNKPERCVDHHDKVVECARILLEAGADRRDNYLYCLPALIAALEAGLPVEEANPTLAAIWGKRTLPQDDFFVHKPTSEKLSHGETRRLAASMIERVRELGVNIDLQEAIGPCASRDVGHVFHLAGVETGLDLTLTEEDAAIGQSARLRRISPQAKGAHHPRRI